MKCLQQPECCAAQSNLEADSVMMTTRLLKCGRKYFHDFCPLGCEEVMILQSIGTPERKQAYSQNGALKKKVSIIALHIRVETLLLPLQTLPTILRAGKGLSPLNVA